MALGRIGQSQRRRLIPRRQPLTTASATGRIRIARFRRLIIRYERRDDIHLAFLTLACAVLCFRFLQRFC